MDRYLERTADLLTGSPASWTAADLAWRPAGKWNGAEIVEHLARAYSGTTMGLERLLASGAPSVTPARFWQRLGVWLVIEAGHLPAGRKSPEVALPVGADPAAVFDLALHSLSAMDDALARTATRFGTRVPVLDHPLLGPLNVRQWRKFHWVHTRHHVRQLAERRRSLGVHR